MLLHQGLRIANKLLNSHEKCDLHTIVSVDSANAELAKRHITFEFLAYLILGTASRMCVDIRTRHADLSGRRVPIGNRGEQGTKQGIITGIQGFSGDNSP